MAEHLSFYIDGAWVEPLGDATGDVIDPSTGRVHTQISYGSEADVDRAVAAASRAFQTWRDSSLTERRDLLMAIKAEYDRRHDDVAAAISAEMGAPIDFAKADQAGAGSFHLQEFIDAVMDLETDHPLAGDPSHRILLKPIGVAALITPWNWPMNQVVLKVGAALAAGCTMVLKPAEGAPLSSMLFAEIMDAAGVPAGVFNLVNGDGPGVGTWLTQHPDVDMVSFTGSTRAGIAITKTAADSGKRVATELGGKSPDLIFADADLESAVARTSSLVFENTGQSCNAPARMLVERPVYDQVVELAKDAAEATSVGPADQAGGHIGPLASKAQDAKVRGLIDVGIEEGARLVVGGSGRPEGLEEGFFVEPTVFADVTPEMRIYREEIFGPVLTITPFDTEDEAVAMANDTDYGLSAYVHTGDRDRAARLASRLRAGMIQFNESGRAAGSPFGGVKLSGNAREGGRFGIEEFLEIVALSGVPSD